jgi:ankyrin repeat protein
MLVKLTTGLLVSMGAQVEAEDIYGNTALHYAAGEGQLDAVQFLLQVTSIFLAYLSVFKGILSEPHTLLTILNHWQEVVDKIDFFI